MKVGLKIQGVVLLRGLPSVDNKYKLFVTSFGSSRLYSYTEVSFEAGEEVSSDIDLFYGHT